jgi:hypothetical protein
MRLTAPLLIASFLTISLSAQIEVASDGKVGIGTASPAQKLHVEAGTNRSVATYLPTGITGIADFSVGGVAWGLSRPSDGARAHLIYTYDNAAGDNNLVVAARSDLVFTTGDGPHTAPERMRITDNGNVGVGAANPAAKLQIGAWNLIKDGTWAPPVTPGSTSAGERLVFYEGGGWKTAIGMDGQNGIWFQTHNPSGEVAYQWFTGTDGSAPTEKMRILTGGNVGIGTTSPSEKLEVNGSIKATSFKAPVNVYADFVFKPDYLLAPLSEVEAHIRTHGHLPGIPSEVEARTEGIDLAVMQVKLLQKIEEITLHQIAQEKRMATLEKENARLASLVFP